MQLFKANKSNLAHYYTFGKSSFFYAMIRWEKVDC